jgi:hypothetical protein
MNSNQNAMYGSLKHHSKRATSRIVVVNGVAVIIQNRLAGDKAILGRVWTSVVAREHIVVEIQLICEQKTNQENIHGHSARGKKKMARNG